MVSGKMDGPTCNWKTDGPSGTSTPSFQQELLGSLEVSHQACYLASRTAAAETEDGWWSGVGPCLLLGNGSIPVSHCSHVLEPARTSLQGMVEADSGVIWSTVGPQTS